MRRKDEEDSPSRSCEPSRTTSTVLLLDRVPKANGGRERKKIFSPRFGQFDKAEFLTATVLYTYSYGTRTCNHSSRALRVHVRVLVHRQKPDRQSPPDDHCSLTLHSSEQRMRWRYGGTRTRFFKPPHSS